MKSLKTLTTLILCLSMTSCIDGQFYKSIKGNGNVVKKERAVSGFDGVRVSTGIDVYLTQGDKEALTVEADENLHEYLVTEVKNNILHIYFDNVNIRDAETKKVHLTMKDIRSLSTSSAGDIVGKSPVRTSDIELSASSAGDILVELYADNVEIDISSSGNIKVSGEAASMDANLSSAGDLEAYDFRVKNANIDVSSAGDARVNVTEKLVARASSAGDVTYLGSPKIVDAHSSSAGSVRGR